MGVWEIFDSYQLGTLRTFRALRSNNPFYIPFLAFFSYCQLFCALSPNIWLINIAATAQLYLPHRATWQSMRSLLFRFVRFFFFPHKACAAHTILLRSWFNTFATKHLNSKTAPAATFRCVTNIIFRTTQYSFSNIFFYIFICSLAWRLYFLAQRSSYLSISILSPRNIWFWIPPRHLLTKLFNIYAFIQSKRS